MKNVLLLACYLIATVISHGEGNDKLWQMYNNQEYSAVIEKTLPLVKKHPKDANLNLLLGRAYTDNEQYAEATPFLEGAITQDKDNGWIKGWGLAYLGICKFMVEDYVKSKDCLKQSLAMNATENLNKFAAKRLALYGFDDVYNDFKVFEKPHIIFHFQPQAVNKIGDIEKYMSLRELAFDSLASYFSAKTPKKIDFFVWDSRDLAEKTLNKPLGFAKSDLCIIHSEIDQTTGHELTHVVSHYLPNMQNQTRLINEGAAMYFDMTSRNRIEMAKKARQYMDTLDIKAMWDNSEISASLLYPIAGAFVEHLIKAEGKDQFLRLYADQTLDNAYKVYGTNMDSIITSFQHLLGDTLTVAEQNAYRAKNIKIIDTSIDKSISTGTCGKKPLIVINGNEYTYDDYQTQKQHLKVLSKDKLKDITLVKGKAAEAFSIGFKNSISDGLFIVTIGDAKIPKQVE